MATMKTKIPAMNNKIALSKPSISMDLSQNGQHLDLFLIGCVGDWGNDIESFLYRIRQMPNLLTIDVYINSLGGSFFDGLPIFNLLQMHTAYVTTKVIGYACSMASVIMLAGDEVQAAQNAIIMIHRAQGVCFGDADDMDKMSEILSVHEQAVIPEYAARLGVSSDEVLTLLQEETWYDSQKALDDGLIDTIIDSMDVQNAGNPLPLPESDNEDDLLTENAAKYALEHYKNIPVDIKQKLESATGVKAKPSFLQKLFTGKKQKPKPVPSNALLTEDIDMTKEELQAAMQASNEKLLADVAKMLKPDPAEPVSNELEEFKAEMAALKTTNADLTEKVTALTDTISAAMQKSDAVDFDLNAGAVTSDEEKY